MLSVKSSENNFVFLPVFYLIMWLMKSFKEFWKNGHFENMRADFFRRCQNSLWQTDDAFAGMIIFFTDIKYVVAFHPIKILTH